MGTPRPRALLPGRLARRAGLLLGLALGCSYTPWSEPSPLSCSEGHDAFDDCCCFFSEEGVCASEGQDCRISVQCTESAWISGQGCPLSGPASLATVVIDPEDVDCALQALHDADGRFVSWAMQARVGSSRLTNELATKVQFTGKQREVFVAVDSITDGHPATDTLRARKSLRAPAYFEECALNETPLARFECITHAVEGPDIEVCERL